MPWKLLEPTPFIEKSTRSVIPSYHLSPEPTLRIPKWNYPLIFREAEASWIIQAIAGIISQEVVRSGWRREPRFKSKCSLCGAEFQDSKEKCAVCGGETRLPSVAQGMMFDRLVSRPNPDYGFGDLLRSLIYYDVVADDWYLAILAAKTENGLRPAEIRAEDTRFWVPIADEYGRLGIDQFYCVVCYKPDVYYDRAGKCPTCGVSLERTAYVQYVTGSVTARSSKEWMVHGSTGRVLPELHGRPKMISVWNGVHTINAMDEYLFDAYSEGKLGGILNFPGYEQDQIKALQAEVQADLQKREVETVGGLYRTKKTVRTLMVGSEQPAQFLRTMPDLDAMQSLQFYIILIQGVCSVFGVQPVSLSFGEKAGGSVAPYIRLEVQNRRVKEVQRDKEEMFNSELFPRFGITDWLFRFNELEPRDELRDAQIKEIDSHTLVNLRAAGFDVRFDENGRLVVPLEPTLEPLQEKRVEGKAKQKPKESQSTGQVIEGTTTERFPSGPRGEPRKVEVHIHSPSAKELLDEVEKEVKQEGKK